MVRNATPKNHVLPSGLTIKEPFSLEILKTIIAGSGNTISIANGIGQNEIDCASVIAENLISTLNKQQ